MTQEYDAGQLGEGLGDVEVAEGTDLEEGDAETLGIHLRLLGAHLTLVRQVQPIPHQDLGHARGMLRTNRETACLQNSIN